MDYKGVPSGGLDFYSLLVNSDEFTSELGKVTLASGKLEAELIILLQRNGIKGKYVKATLGSLINEVDKHNLLDKRNIDVLKLLSNQRNYISHNIYALFTDLIDETILEKNNLLDSDIHLYIERAWQLRINLEESAIIIHEKNK